MSVSKVILRIVGTMISITAVLVLYGWVVNNKILKAVSPDLVSMNPLSAVLLICLGIFLGWQTYVQSKLNQILRIFFCVTIIILSLTVMLKYFFHIDLRIDELLFTSKLAGNRMALSTAFCFLLLGNIFLFINTKRKSLRIALQIALLLVLLIAGQGIIIDIFNFAGIFQYEIFVPIALNVSVCFVALSMSIFAVRKDFEVSIFIRNLFNRASINQKINVFLSLGLALLLVVGLVTFVTTKQLIDSSSSVTIKIEKIKLRTQLINDLVNADVAHLGFIVTDQGDYLVPYANGISDYSPTFQKLLHLAENSTEIANLHHLDALAQQKLANIAMTLNVHRTQGFNAAQKVVRNNTGKDVMDEIRNINEQMDAADQNDLVNLTKKDALASGRSISTVFLGSVLGLTIIVLGIFIINKDLKKSKNKN